MYTVLDMYFKNHTVNTLFIHIPKTGGTAVELYLSRLYNIPMCKSSLYSFDHTFSNVSLQHQLLSTILTNHTRFNIKLSNLMIFSIVRNPYTRCVSDLIFLKIITGKEDTKTITGHIKSYLNIFMKNNTATDNHIRPQVDFLIVDGKINRSIHILRQENLSDGMKTLGFNNFPSQTEPTRNYYNLLTYEAVCIINTVYIHDFLEFDYDMIMTEADLKLRQTVVTDSLSYRAP